MKPGIARSDAIAILADEIRKRRAGCPLLLAVQILSAVVACDLTQDEVDEAERLADELDDLSTRAECVD